MFSGFAQFAIPPAAAGDAARYRPTSANATLPVHIPRIINPPFRHRRCFMLKLSNEPGVSDTVRARLQQRERLGRAASETPQHFTVWAPGARSDHLIGPSTGRSFTADKKTPR